MEQSLTIASVLLAIIALAPGCGGGGGSTAPAYRLYGLGFGPFLELNPDLGETVSTPRIISLLSVMLPLLRVGRARRLLRGSRNIPRLAKAAGLKVAATAWLTGDVTANATGDRPRWSRLMGGPGGLGHRRRGDPLPQRPSLRTGSSPTSRR